MLGPRELGARSPGTEACQPERPVLALRPDHGWETLARGGEARGPLQLFHPSGQEHWGQTDLLPGSATLPSRPETCYRGPAPQPRPGLWAQRLRRPGDRWDWEAAPRLTRSRGQSPTAQVTLSPTRPLCLLHAVQPYSGGGTREPEGFPQRLPPGSQPRTAPAPPRPAATSQNHCMPQGPAGVRLHVSVPQCHLLREALFDPPPETPVSRDPSPTDFFVTPPPAGPATVFEQAHLPTTCPRSTVSLWRAAVSLPCAHGLGSRSA